LLCYRAKEWAESVNNDKDPMGEKEIQGIENSVYAHRESPDL